ncbi:SUF system NifU family Fe-S cluster assembly protein [Candidatus Woesearchaeota archaeon]|nr:SUF system NifU family Fe-S cluster assembly protein [Candidatus Woesearchaeota archaeon]
MIDKNKLTDRALSEEEEIYKENILDYYKHPKNKKELKTKTKAHDKNTLCGDEITIYLRIKANKIQEATFTGNGCAISQASASMLTEKLKGLTLKQAKAISKDDILKMLGIPLSFMRTKCALLSLKVLNKALEESK